MDSVSKTRRQSGDAGGDLRERISALESENARLREEINRMGERGGYYFPRMERMDEALFVIFDRKFEFVNPAFEGVFGYEEGEIMANNLDFMKLIEPDSRNTVRRRFREGLKGEFRAHQFEFEGLKKDGRKVGCEVSIIFIPYKWGTAIHGVLHDVSMRKRVNNELQRNMDRMQVALDAIPASVFYLDSDHRFIRINHATSKLLKLPPGSIIGKTLAEIFPNIPPDQLAHFVQDNQEVMTSGCPRRGIIEAMPTVKGRKWVQTDRMPCHDEEGKVNGIVCLAIDITNIRETEEKLWYLSFHDVLTGLYNRAYLEEELVKLDGSRQLPVSIVTVKVDNYGATGLTEGSEAADELVKRTADVLKVFRTEDVVGRIAEDKFAAILPQTPAEAANEAVRRTTKSLEHNNKRHETPLELKLRVMTKEKGGSLTGLLAEAEGLV